MKTTAIIIDDEEGARESLANILSRYFPQIELVGKAGSAQEGYEIIKHKHPKLVFLDIEMPVENAFDLINKFDKINFDIIFVTAYDHYAIQAIKVCALDYLLKPIDIDELKSALQKFEDKSHQPEQFELLMETIKSSRLGRKIVVPEIDGLTFIAAEDIIRCESDGNYTMIYLKGNKKITSSKTLGDYEEILKDEPFFRIHRSHLINLNEIYKFVKSDGAYVIMNDNSEVEISRRKKQEFLDLLART